MTSARRRQAVVVGAGIAGVTAARVLADRFDRVLVLERDPEVTPRPHVPHQPHTHVLGTHGYRALCRLFDGLEEELAEAGAPRFDFGECPFFAGQWAPRQPFGLVSRSCTRPLLERLLRRRLATRSNVELLTRQRVRGYVLEGERVVAVRFEDDRELGADLVVDAAGVGSKTPEWIARHGFPAPDRSEVDLHGGVVSQLFRPAPGRGRGWVILNVRRSADNYRHGVISWVEDGLWRVSLWGVAGVRPSRELPGFLAFARAMRTPIIAELLEGAEPVSAAAHYANSWSRWLRYDRLPRFPDGLVVVGSATFHPNYEHGQGMTFCVMTAELIGEHVDHHGLGVRGGSSLQFQRAQAALLAPWWEWNLSAELTVPGLDAGPQPRAAMLQHRYFRMMREAGARDADVWKAVLEVNQAMRPPSSLLHPSLLWRALRQRGQPPPSDNARVLLE
ncbi:MAG TPA: FAD-dependent oxidoreductase [Kofleriaceae bacterium]|nr:FAD-dependent oxidoreductase [Kofleriaceae bacterium]